VAGGSRHLGIHHWERTNELLERRQREPLVWSSGPNASCRDLVAAVAAAERKPGFWWVSPGDVTAAGRGAAGVSGVSRSPTNGEGQGGVRSVHGGAPHAYRFVII